MDNRTIDVVSEGEDSLALALKLIWPSAPGGKATHYLIKNYGFETKYYQDTAGKVTHHFDTMIEDDGKRGVSTLILLWHEEGAAVPLPFPLDLTGVTQFVQNWLKVVDYGPQPDIDGSSDHGWRVFTERWGHVAGFHYAIVAIQPEWALYGK